MTINVTPLPHHLFKSSVFQLKPVEASEDRALCLAVALNVKPNCGGELALGLAVLRRTLPYQEMMKALGI